MTKVLLVGAGAGVSTKDVEMGYYEALEELGIDLSYYCLDQRIATATKWLRYQWRYLFNKDPMRAPTWADAVYRGGIEALEMALRYEVDLVLIISAMYLHPDVLVMMKRAGLHVGILLTESPYEDERQARVASIVDVVFTNERTSVDYLRQFNAQTFYIRHAYSPFRHRPSGTAVTGAPVQTEHDVVFVGTGFQERIEVLQEVDWTGINMGLYGDWSLLSPKSKLKDHVMGQFLSNIETHNLYKESKVGLNLYRTSKSYNKKSERIEVAESMNPRAYELAAAGIFSLTQVRQEGVETLRGSQPTFTTPSLLEKQIRYYLDKRDQRDVSVREAVGLIQGHTFIERAKEVLSYGVN